MILLGLLPLLVLLLLAVGCPGNGPRGSHCLINALLLWGVVLVALTEGLSLLHALTPAVVTAAWLAVTAGMIGWLVRKRVSLKGRLSAAREFLSAHGGLALAGGAAIGAVTLFTLLISAPNYWDALTYHLPRVMHWAQQGSVQHTFTHNTRQLAMPPFSEFLILHLRLLTGSDRLAALPQWMSMIASAVVVSLITARLTTLQHARTMAVAAALTIPGALLQASSVQTDYVVTLWLAVFACCVLEVVQQEGPPAPGQALWTGAALGLALLSKATAYLFAAPFVLWFAVVTLRRNARRAMLAAGVIAAVTLAINTGHYARNIAWFGSPLGSGNEFAQSVNERFGLDITVSNMLRNASMHLGTSPEYSEKVKEAVIALHALLGLDPEDPAATWDRLKYVVWPMSPYENTTGNLVHFLLGVTAFLLTLVRSDLRSDKPLVTYQLMLFAGFVIFSSFLKWTHVHQRLQLPLFVMAAPVLGAVYSRLLRPLSIQILAAGLLALTVPLLLFNSLRPLLPSDLTWHPSVLTTPRSDQYFYELEDLQPMYGDMVSMIEQTGCRQIGLVSGLESFEYPLWVLLESTGQDYTLRHVPMTAPADVCLIVYMREITSYQLVGDYELTGEVLYSSDYLILSEPGIAGSSP
jgi:4-amino-4-deoxy-L-arabinose transferase-like glycosyltransferase